jgi:PAS domain S-box-containing protein
VTHSAPPADLADLSPQEAAAFFDPEQAPQDWRSGNARLAIVSPPARIVVASAAALAFFAANDFDALEARLIEGGGPSARRLRHLAATLPIGEPPRLERMLFVVDRRPASVTFRCARVAAAQGATLLFVSIPALGAASAELREAPRSNDPAPPDFGRLPPPKSRFLWTLDEQGRFGAAHPALAAALGASAPHRGETVEALLGRAELEGGDELVGAIAGRQTFSGVTVGWPLPGEARRRLVALSAAPLFGRHREFLGYRGFGVLGEEIDASRRRGTGLAPEPAEGATFEPDRAPTPDAAPFAAVAEAPPPRDDAPLAPTEPVAPLAAAAISADEPPLHEEPAAESNGRGGGAEVIEANLKAAPTDDLEPPPPREASLEAEGSESAPTRPEAGEAGAAQSHVPQPESAEPAAASGAQSVPADRRAEIYVLRHPAPAAMSKIVPIRPGALDALPMREPPQGSPAEGVELSRSERDAFREIARALVGRAPAAHDERAGEVEAVNPVAAARGMLDLAFGAPNEPPAAPQAELASPGGADDEAVQRNARGVLDRLPIGALVARNARALYANRTLLDLVGYRDFAAFQEADGLMMMFRGRDPQMTAADSGAVPIIRADGQTLSVEGHAQAIAWEGAPATLIALRRSQDAEHQAKLRALEREAPARNGAASDLQAMLDRATDGALTVDSAGRILTLNRPAERLFGYDQNEIAGESLLMLLAPQSHPETTARLESLSRAGESEATQRPLQVVGRDRGGAPLALGLTLARIGAGEAPHFSALMRDLSREREAERRLIAARDAADAASAAKTDFLAQVSHEIRTPLHAILGFAEVMMEERFGPLGNERYKDYLKDIHASGSHVMSLADDLLDLSKIEAGKLELTFAPVDANNVIRECVSLIQPQAARERVIMRVSLYDRLPRVMVDERSLKQIMLNLMSNAVKFNEPGGQVIVSTAVDAAGQAVIRVRDTGVGMNENEVGVALAPFGRVGKANGKGGAGLGLPLTKALVEANKAEFSIKSRREQGTLIEIAFPNVQAAE